MSDLKRVIVDVDVGLDDYLALLVLLNAEKNGEIKIEGIVCSAGNTSLDNVCKNVVRLLEIVGRTDIPVFRGASRQLICLSPIKSTYYGRDGFGDLHYDKMPDVSIIREEPAACCVANLVLKNPNEITLICVGPLTNLALAVRLYENFADSLRDVWILGGNYTAVGNVTATAEFNFYFDPEAAHVALGSVKKPIYMLTWETCLAPQITFEWRESALGSKNSPAVELLNRAEHSVYKTADIKDAWKPCDAFLAASFLHPDGMIAKKSCHHASIELHGSQTRGQVVLDHSKNNPENVTIIEQIDAEFFKNLLLKL